MSEQGRKGIMELLLDVILCLEQDIHHVFWSNKMIL